MPAKKVAEFEGVYEQPTLDDNMRFYKLVQDTPKQAQKSFNNGRFQGTDINPMWRIKRLTEVFGPCGFGWWTQNVKYDFVNAEQTNEVAVFCELDLIVVDPTTGKESKPIYGVGGNTFVVQRKNGAQSSDEAKKMAYTDALSIACKALGFSHDIYYAKDPTKYTDPDFQDETENASNQEDLTDFYERIKKGIAIITKEMSDDEKTVFAQEVVQKHIGSTNYLACKDSAKLQALLTELREMAKPKKTA